MNVTFTRNEDGDFEYRNEAGQLHNEYGPAIVKSTGEQYFYQNGVLIKTVSNIVGGCVLNAHDKDRNAGRRSKVTSVEYKNDAGETHKTDGPAIVYSDGTQLYYLNGLLHREDGPAVITARGAKMYYINGSLHREDGPAVEYSRGRNEYFLDGLCNISEGPAFKWKDGHMEFWLNGVQVKSLECKTPV